MSADTNAFLRAKTVSESNKCEFFEVPGEIERKSPFSLVWMACLFLFLLLPTQQFKKGIVG